MGNMISDALTGWIKQIFIDGILDKYAGIFDSINEEVGKIAGNVGQTPAGWNPAIFGMVKTLSETVVIPVAGMILTFVLCYELIQLILEKNNMAEFDVYNIYKWMVKSFIAVFILTNTYNIVMSVFDLAQNVVNNSAGVIQNTLNVGTNTSIADLRAMLDSMGIGELIGVWFELSIIGICMQVLTIVITIIIFGRMIEIYLTVSIAPIPLSTMANREWGQIGQNYLKSLFALAFQGFLIMVCVAIYAILVQSIPSANSVHAGIWRTAGYTLLLCVALFKTGSLSKSLFSAH